MRDPHVHAEKTILGVGHVEMSDFIGRAIGLAVDMPKTVGTGCGRRRQLADTSKVPEKVTCLACREWAAAQEIEMAKSAEALLSLGAEQLAALGTPDKPALTIPELRDLAAGHRAMAARYA
jgi:hypothetical protein